MFKYALIIIFVLIFNPKAYSLELLMINSKSCTYCKYFLSEVAPEYNLSGLPLVIIDDFDRPKWFSKAYKNKQIKPYRGTPIFIIWNEIEKNEIGRIIGYRSKDNFYRNLKDQLNIFINNNSS